MPAITARVETTDKDGKPVNLNSNGGEGVVSSRYDLVPEGYYNAVVKKVTFETFEAGYKGQGDKKFKYGKFIPVFELLNDNQTTINRQGFILGVFNKDGELYRPDGDTGSPIFGGETGAKYLLTALGEVDAEGNAQLDERLFFDRVVRVKVVTATYKNKDGVEGKKNVVKEVRGLHATQIEEGGFHLAEGRVFLTEPTYDAFTVARAQIADGEYVNDVPDENGNAAGDF